MNMKSIVGMWEPKIVSWAYRLGKHQEDLVSLQNKLKNQLKPYYLLLWPNPKSPLLPVT